MQHGGNFCFMESFTVSLCFWKEAAFQGSGREMKFESPTGTMCVCLGFVGLLGLFLVGSGWFFVVFFACVCFGFFP